MSEARPVPSEPDSSPLIEGPVGGASADDSTPVGRIGADPIGPDTDADERDDEFGAVDSEPMDIPAPPHARQDKDHLGTDWDLTHPVDHAPDQLP